MVAVCHLHAKGTTKEVSTGLIELGQAAALGSEVACYALAKAYHLGIYGLEKDSSKVQHWVAKARRARGNGKCDSLDKERAELERSLN